MKRSMTCDGGSSLLRGVGFALARPAWAAVRRSDVACRRGVSPAVRAVRRSERAKPTRSMKGRCCAKSSGRRFWWPPATSSAWRRATPGSAIEMPTEGENEPFEIVTANGRPAHAGGSPRILSRVEDDRPYAPQLKPAAKAKTADVRPRRLGGSPPVARRGGDALARPVRRGARKCGFQGKANAVRGEAGVPDEIEEEPRRRWSSRRSSSPCAGCTS